MLTLLLLWCFNVRVQLIQEGQTKGMSPASRPLPLPSVNRHARGSSVDVAIDKNDHCEQHGLDCVKAHKRGLIADPQHLIVANISTPAHLFATVIRATTCDY